MFSFEKLEVYKEVIKLEVKIYNTTILFPSEEKDGLTSQMQPSSVSFSSNITEGNTRLTNKDKALFMTMYTSAIELLNQHKIFKNLNLIS